MVVSILIFLVVLSVLVLVHEFGHFMAARRAGIWVEEFGFGLPPRVIGKKVGDTLYSINLLPIGGFVRLHGENSEEEVTQPAKAFLNKSKLTRTIIVLAGVAMNFLLAVVAFSLVYSFTGVPRKTDKVSLVAINPGSPAESAELQVGDVIKEINGKEIKSNADFVATVDSKKGEEVALKYLRGEEVREVKLTPRDNPPEGEGALGVLISDEELYFPPWWQRPFVGVVQGFKEALFWGKVVIIGFVDLFVNLFAGVAPKEVAGPVGIFALTSEAAKYGILPLINFLGILSINLAILNAVPFPALDGGRLLFIVIESVFGRKVVPRVEQTIHTVGMIILLILIFLITASDIQKLISNGGIAGYLKSVLK